MLLIRRAVVYYTPCATVNLIQEAGSHTKTLITLLAFSVFNLWCCSAINISATNAFQLVSQVNIIVIIRQT